MRWNRYLFFLLIFSFTTIISYSQPGYSKVAVVSSDSASQNYLDLNPIKISARITDIEQYKNLALNILQQRGYVNASIDSVIYRDDILFVQVTLSDFYEWKYLKFSDAAIVALTSYAGFEENGHQFNNAYIVGLIEHILGYYENIGYPFVKTWLDSIQISDNSISALLQVDKGEIFSFDTIFVRSNFSIDYFFLQNYLGFSKNQFWNEKNFTMIFARIDNLEFMKLNQMPKVSFYGQNAAIELDLIAKRSNTFDAIIGFYSDPITNKVEFSGSVNLRLLNSLGFGDEFKFNWQRPVQGNQFLNLVFIQPYLFKTKWGISNDFTLFRRDSVFVNVNNNASLNYRFNYNTYFSLKGDFENSQITLIQVDSNLFSSRSSLFGMGFYSDNRDYKVNPSKGFLIDFDVLAGQRTQFQKTDNQIYTDIKHGKVMMKLNFEYYYNFFKDNVLVFKNLSKSLWSENLTYNELFRIGGLNTLRGFDEQSLITDLYSISSFEYRFLMSKNSNISLFYNGALINSAINSSSDFKYYSGFGMGAFFDSSAGVISLYLAVGKNPEQNIALRNTKLHLGYLIKF
jgi:hypothetical protein